MKSNSNIVWIDIETTGLDLNTETILEVACIVTDKDLNPLDGGISLIIHHNKSIESTMGEWCLNTHTKNGLLDLVYNSQTSLSDAESALLSYMQLHTNPGECMIAGNSIGFDKSFLQKFMPSIVNHLHYRILDVTCFKQAARMWATWITPYKKAECHRAVDDIKESIEEMKYLKRHMFITKFESENFRLNFDKPVIH